VSDLDVIADAIADRVAARLADRLAAETPTVERLLFSVPDAAEMLSVSKALLWDRVADGRIRSTTIASRRLIPVEEIRRLADEGVT
jgi:hypothetical protein